MHDMNAATRIERENALKETMTLERNGSIAPPERTKFVNNHIHTTYSFSPYSPTAAAYCAYRAGLETAGIMDHDSVSGVEEFIKAGEIIGIPVTGGCELRVDFSKTPLGGRRINNPDQKDITYVAAHGIPRNKLPEIDAFLAPIRRERGERNRRMTGNINALMSQYGVTIDYDKDVLPLSMAHEGGSVTERHLLYALGLRMISVFGKGDNIVSLLTDKLGMTLPDKIRAFLSDADNSMYEYDLLGALKSDLVDKIYVPADSECPDVKDYIAMTKRVGAISAYPYLGDVGSSVTGDKKAQTFEDAYLDELFPVLVSLGFDAVTYMPTRNTAEQLSRVISLCEKHNLFQISGEDINSPRQSFICPALLKPQFAHLYTSTYALIGHELAATRELSSGMFSKEQKRQFPDIGERVLQFADMS